MSKPLYDGTIITRKTQSLSAAHPSRITSTDPAVPLVSIQDAEDESLRRYKEKVWSSPPPSAA